MCCVRCDFRSHSGVAKLLIMFNFSIFKGCVLVVLADTVKIPARLNTELNSFDTNTFLCDNI